MRWSASQNENLILRTKKEDAREHKRVGKLSQDTTALTSLRNECGWIIGVDASGGNTSISQKPGQMFLEVNSDQKMNSLPTLLFFKTLIFIAFLYFDWGKAELRVTLVGANKMSKAMYWSTDFFQRTKKCHHFLYLEIHFCFVLF